MLKLKKGILALLVCLVVLTIFSTTAYAAVGDPCRIEECTGTYIITSTGELCPECLHYACSDSACSGTVVLNNKSGSCNVCGKTITSRVGAATYLIRSNSNIEMADPTFASMIKENGGLLFTSLLIGVLLGIGVTLLALHIRRKRKKQ